MNQEIFQMLDVLRSEMKKQGIKVTSDNQVLLFALGYTVHGFRPSNSLKPREECRVWAEPTV